MTFLERQKPSHWKHLGTRARRTLDRKGGVCTWEVFRRSKAYETFLRKERPTPEQIALFAAGFSQPKARISAPRGKAA